MARRNIVIEIQRLQLAGSSSTVFAVNLILYCCSKKILALIGPNADSELYATTGAIDSTKHSGHFGPKLNGRDPFNRSDRDMASRKP